MWNKKRENLQTWSYRCRTRVNWTRWCTRKKGEEKSILSTRRRCAEDSRNLGNLLANSASFGHLVNALTKIQKNGCNKQERRKSARYECIRQNGHTPAKETWDLRRRRALLEVMNSSVFFTAIQTTMSFKFVTISRNIRVINLRDQPRNTHGFYHGSWPITTLRGVCSSALGETSSCLTPLSGHPGSAWQKKNGWRGGTKI